MDHGNFSFSQSMLVMMSNSSPSTLSRTAAKMDLKSTRESGRRKYNFEESRAILKELVAENYEIEKKYRSFLILKEELEKQVYAIRCQFTWHYWVSMC
ncbi:MAG TPA: hypothetical protein QKA08_02315 [Candidatus Megaira endosymbiont of Nemacystus decipiens]|nr:hypothetical protein [Candidatus Megaera endosymbiont of Nemacystus decipiens]